MNRFTTFCSLVVLVTLCGSARADEAPTLSVNPALNRAYLILDDGKTVTMDATTRMFTFRTASGQTATVSFEQVAQLETPIPADQQALLNEWVSIINNPSNTFTLTDSHEPTLGLSESGLPPPPGFVDIQGHPGIGYNSMLSIQGGLDALTQGTQGGPVTDCAFVPCSCQFGECYPGSGQPWGLWGMIYYSLDGGGGGGPGRSSEAKQRCLRDHESAWLSQQGASCALMNGLGMTAAYFGAVAGGTCAAAAATSGAAIAPCAKGLARFAVAATAYLQARQACRSPYPGPGSACAGL
jgi:hypothetical protein